jgi:hypothetical protein
MKLTAPNLPALTGVMDGLRALGWKHGGAAA